MSSLIGKTVPGTGMDSIFKEVHHNEKLGLRNPEQLRLFHLNVSNNRFVFKSLEDYLTDIISEYVFSRVQVQKLTDPKSGVNPRSIGLKALRIMKKNGVADQKGTGNELGEILLYAFLEEKLGAYKLFSKVELNSATTPFGKESDSIHLLSLGDVSGMTCYQTVFGTSNIKGKIRTAIDNAFEAIVRIENETSEGIHIVSSSTLEESFEPDMLKEVIRAIVPKPGSSVVSDNAYGVFLGYSLGLDPSTRSNMEFLHALDKKMESDIKHHAGYIADKIKILGLDSHSFYFYIVPFNDAEVDKKQIMENLMM